MSDENANIRTYLGLYRDSVETLCNKRIDWPFECSDEDRISIIFSCILKSATKSVKMYIPTSDFKIPDNNFKLVDYRTQIGINNPSCYPIIQVLTDGEICNDIQIGDFTTRYLAEIKKAPCDVQQYLTNLFGYNTYFCIVDSTSFIVTYTTESGPLSYTNFNDADKIKKLLIYFDSYFEDPNDNKITFLSEPIKSDIKAIKSSLLSRIKKFIFIDSDVE